MASDDPPDEALEEFERRAHPRAEANLTMRLVRVDEEGYIAGEEQAMAEELAPGGTRVATGLALLSGERVWIEEPGGGFGSWGEVRAISTGEDGVRRAGLAFLPHAGGPPSPRRSHDRLTTRVALVLTRLDANGAPVESERTLTEDVSPGGARIVTRLESISPGDVVGLREAGGGFRTWARVKNVWRGPDGVRRLNLEFEEPLQV